MSDHLEEGGVHNFDMILQRRGNQYSKINATVRSNTRTPP